MKFLHWYVLPTRHCDRANRTYIFYRAGGKQKSRSHILVPASLMMNCKFANQSGTRKMMMARVWMLARWEMSWRTCYSKER